MYVNIILLIAEKNLKFCNQAVFTVIITLSIT